MTPPLKALGFRPRDAIHRNRGTSRSEEERLEYFFGNARNDQGLCATPGCQGKADHWFVYKYCHRCHGKIRDLLDSDAAPIVGQFERAVVPSCTINLRSCGPTIGSSGFKTVPFRSAPAAATAA